VDWDDDINITKNPWFRGFTAMHVGWLATNMLMGHYIPVTWLTFALDHAVWGMNPFGYHLTNVVLHGLNAGLFFLTAMQLLGRATTWSAARLRMAGVIATLFFAVHPLRAESVAWVTERRDVLSGFFFLLSVLGYLKAEARAGRARRLLLAGSLAAFALALLSKSIVMGLPLVLLALDVYPLRRLSLTQRGLAAGRAALIEKLPYFALAIAGAGMSYWAVRANSFLTPFDAYPWSARVAMGFYSLWFYVTTTVLPIGLSPLYELPYALSPLEPRYAVAILGVLAISAIAWLLRHRFPAPLAVWVCYVVILGPVTGVIHSGNQLAHDRYSYLSCLGWALLVGAGVAALVEAGRARRIRPAIAAVGGGAMALWIVALACLTWQQQQIWKNSESLWSYAVDSDDRCAICHGNLGIHLVNRGDVKAGIPHIERAIALRPDRIRTHANLGLAFMLLGRHADAKAEFNTVLAKYPDHADVLSAMAVALIRDGRAGESIGYLRRALQAEPLNVIARTNHGTALTHLGLRSAALEEYRYAITVDPASAPARFGLGWALVRFGDPDAAREQLPVLRTLDPLLAAKLVHEIEGRQ
jgi:Flp pilus assembly protein TadD